MRDSGAVAIAQQSTKHDTVVPTQSLKPMNQEEVAEQQLQLQQQPHLLPCESVALVTEVVTTAAAPMDVVLQVQQPEQQLQQQGVAVVEKEAAPASIQEQQLQQAPQQQESPLPATTNATATTLASTAEIPAMPKVRSIMEQANIAIDFLNRDSNLHKKSSGLL